MRATRLMYRAFSVVSLESGGSGVLSVPHSRLQTAMRSRAALDELLVSDCVLERRANIDTEAVARLWALLLQSRPFQLSPDCLVKNQNR